MRNLISILDLDDHLDEVLEMSSRYKSSRGFHSKPLSGKILGLIFSKPSTRTRVSLEVAIKELGGDSIYLDWNQLQLSRGESIKDTAIVLSRYLSGIALRAQHHHILEFAKHSKIPVINALSDLEHPCQVVGDLLTILEHKRRLEGIKLAWIGDGNNVCNSLILGCSLTGIQISIACPEGYEPDRGIVSLAHSMGAEIRILRDAFKAVEDADVIYTDVWVSMGEESQFQRRIEDFRKYQLNSELIKHAPQDAIVMHCLPAMRGYEITDDVLDGPRSVVWDQAENRLHSQKGILSWIFQD